MATNRRKFLAAAAAATTLAAQARDQFRNLPYISRFAPLPAIGHGRQVRAVGLEHEPVERRGGKRLAHIPGVLERHDACEADQ